ncbi:hypothetical protein CEXT_645641 [Caerostris extrusa]|uniref:Uncharacterized protein n=1 Tax=Caerostris extrusa TaxID=172846 RepID=A0AAV4MTM7_CAEEX|nr:hypothetical protein CEXT_645641 [Caerostris extrusa]
MVNAALSVLQNKSSKNEKSAVRYHQSKDAKNESSVKSKIATYFQKSVINKDLIPSNKVEVSEEDLCNINLVDKKFDVPERI